MSRAFHLQTQLAYSDACSVARTWVAERTLEEAWDRCPMVDWMAWQIGTLVRIARGVYPHGEKWRVIYNVIRPVGEWVVSEIEQSGERTGGIKALVRAFDGVTDNSKFWRLQQDHAHMTGVLNRYARTLPSEKKAVNFLYDIAKNLFVFEGNVVKYASLGSDYRGYRVFVHGETAVQSCRSGAAWLRGLVPFSAVEELAHFVWERDTLPKMEEPWKTPACPRLGYDPFDGDLQALGEPSLTLEDFQ